MREDWVEFKLGEIADYINGRAFNPKEWEREGIPIIRIQNLNNPNAKYNYSTKKFEEKYKIYCEDLLFAWSASLGAYIWKGHDAWLNQHIFKVLPRFFCDKKFLFYILTEMISRLYARSHGSGMVHITKKEFEKTIIFLPPLPIQRAIVAKIEELFTSLDKGITDLKKAQDQLKVYRQAVLKKAFEGEFIHKTSKKENRLPEGWKWVTFDDVCTKIGDIDHKMPKQVDGNGFPYISTKDITEDNKISFSNAKYISKNDFERLSKKIKPEKNDIIFPRYGTIGRNILIDFDKDFLVSYSCAIIKPDCSIVNPLYIFYYSLSPKIKEEIKKYTVETTQANIGIASIKKFVFPLPKSKTEQQQIIKEIESRLSVCDKLEQGIAENLEKAQALRQSILKKAFSGGLLSEAEIAQCKQETDYEPAEKLLAKIKGISKEEPRRKLIPLQPKKEEPKKISADVHAGVIAKIVKLHEENPEHLAKLSHVKCEKIAHLAEYHIGIALGRNPVKDAAGPDDYPHLNKVETRAKYAGYFTIQKLDVGRTYTSGRNLTKVIDKLDDQLSDEKKDKLDSLIKLFLEFDLIEAELVATIYAGWNNLLIDGKSPTDEEIVWESRENWSKRKLSIDRKRFFEKLDWMRREDIAIIPTGKGQKVEKPKKRSKK